MQNISLHRILLRSSAKSSVISMAVTRGLDAIVKNIGSLVLIYPHQASIGTIHLYIIKYVNYTIFMQ